MTTWHDLPIEVIVEIFRYLRVEELLPLAIVDREWRGVIGTYFTCEQFQCSWAEVWERISHPQQISLYQFPGNVSYGLYDPHTESVLTIRSTLGESHCAIHTYSTPALPEQNTQKKKILSLDDSIASTHSAPRGVFARHWILQSGEILLIDDLGYLYHLHKPLQAPLGNWDVQRSPDSFTNGKKIRSYAACLFSYREEEYLFLCGGRYQQDVVSNQWAVYNCSQQRFDAEGILPEGKTRLNHSVCAYYDRDTGEPFLLVTGGKESPHAFTANSVLSDAVVVRVFPHPSSTEPSCVPIPMNQTRNLHMSYLNSHGHIVVLGGTAVHTGEKFSPDDQTFANTLERISLKWDAAMVHHGDNILVERVPLRLIEEVNPLTGCITLGSQSLLLSWKEKRASDPFRWSVTEHHGVLYALMRSEEGPFYLQRIPQHRLRIGIPRKEEIHRVSQKGTPQGLACGDGFLYALDTQLGVVDALCFSLSFPNEITRTVREWSGRPDCFALQFHFLSSTAQELRVILWGDVLDNWPGLMYIGLDLMDRSHFTDS